MSFDGGGVRGAISVAFLARIEEIFAEHQRKVLTDYVAKKERANEFDGQLAAAKDKLKAPFRLADWFDLVGGTSTGSLIAGAIALGYTTSNIEEFYLERASKIFRRPVLRRFNVLQARFDARGLQQEIDQIVKGRMLESDELLTGLTVVAKRMDTGSPWILTNNPRAPYWNTKLPSIDKEGNVDKGYIGNRYYKLATLVRASTAAPYYFDPEILPIIAPADEKAPEDTAKGSTIPLSASETKAALRGVEGEKDALSDVNDSLVRFPRLTLWLTRLRALMIAKKEGAHPDTHGLFIDGGVTPFNNPSLALLMQVVLKPYGMCWPLGPDKLTFVSIGTGSFRSRLSFTELGFAGKFKLAIHSLMSIMSDTQNMALAQMQWLGECPSPWPINSELDTLAGDVPPGHHWFRFMRYDLPLDRKWIKNNLQQNVSDADCLLFQKMDDPAIIEPIYALAKIAAEQQVKPEHFFPELKKGSDQAGAA
jgi:Patatin-like phospholipase